MHVLVGNMSLLWEELTIRLRKSRLPKTRKSQSKDVIDWQHLDRGRNVNGTTFDPLATSCKYAFMLNKASKLVEFMLISSFHLLNYPLYFLCIHICSVLLLLPWTNRRIIENVDKEVNTKVIFGIPSDQSLILKIKT